MNKISITPRAAQEITNIIANKNIPVDYSLRVLVQGGGGCGAGMQYRLGFDKEKETDERLDINGVRVIYDKKHLLYIIGVEIDFEELEDEQGFVFSKKSKQ